MVEKIVVNEEPGEDFAETLVKVLEQMFSEPDQLQKQEVVLNNKGESIAGFVISIVEDDKLWIQFEEIWPSVIASTISTLAKEFEGEGMVGGIIRIPY